MVTMPDLLPANYRSDLHPIPPSEYLVRMKNLLLLTCCTLISASAMAQELPFSTIPDYLDEYTEHTTVIRMIEGLGYRYYWATEGLRPEDLAYQPSADARSTRQTLEHIYSLSVMIINGTTSTPNTRQEVADLSFEELRAGTLNNFQTAVDNLFTDEPLTDRQMVWLTETGAYTLSFWHLINGPISDAIYHTGQVVSFRRSSGNPMSPDVDVLRGQ